MIRRMIATIKSGLGLAAGFAFTIVAAPVIHLSGAEDADICPTSDEVKRSQEFAAELKAKYGDKEP